METVTITSDQYIQFMGHFDPNKVAQEQIGNIIKLAGISEDQVEVRLYADGCLTIILLDSEMAPEMMAVVLSMTKMDIRYFEIPHGTRDLDKPQPSHGLFMHAGSISTDGFNELTNRINWYKEGMVYFGEATKNIAYKIMRGMRWQLYAMLERFLGL